MVRFAEGRAGEDFICVVEIRVEMIQKATSSCSAFDMLIEFRKYGS